MVKPYASILMKVSQEIPPGNLVHLPGRLSIFDDSESSSAILRGCSTTAGHRARLREGLSRRGAVAHGLQARSTAARHRAPSRWHGAMPHRLLRKEGLVLLPNLSGPMLIRGGKLPLHDRSRHISARTPRQTHRDPQAPCRVGRPAGPAYARCRRRLSTPVNAARLPA